MRFIRVETAVFASASRQSSSHHMKTLSPTQGEDEVQDAIDGVANAQFITLGQIRSKEFIEHTSERE